MKHLAVLFCIFAASTIQAQTIDLNTLHGNDSLALTKGGKITFVKTTALPNLTCMMTGMDPTAMFVAGFGINADVSVLPMAPGGGGVLPANLPVAPMSVTNIGKAAVASGYVISFKLYAMTFVAVVGGQAGYSKGMLVASSSIVGPALQPEGSSPMSSPTSGAGSFTPQLPNPLPCGLYELVITIDTANTVVESDKKDNVCISYIYSPGIGQPFTFSWDLTPALGNPACPPGANLGAVEAITQAAAAGKCAGVPASQLPGTPPELAPGWCPAVSGSAPCAPYLACITNYIPPPVAYRAVPANPPGFAPFEQCWVQVTVTPPQALLNAGLTYNVSGWAQAGLLAPANTCDDPSIGDNAGAGNAGGLPNSSPSTVSSTLANSVIMDCNVGGYDCVIQAFPPTECVFTTSVTWHVTAISNGGCVISSSDYTQYVTHRSN